MRFRPPLATRLLLALVVLFVALLPGQIRPAAAHPADMYFQEHTVTFTPDGLTVQWTISPGALLAFLTWDDADVDGDSFVSEQEAIDWVVAHVADIVSVIDGDQVLPWAVEVVEWPSSIARFEMGEEKILTRMRAAWPAGFAGRHDFILYSRFEEASSVNWFYLNGDDGVGFTRPQQQNGLLQLAVDVSGEGDDLLAVWDSGTPALVASEGTTPAMPARTASAVLTDLVSREDMSPLFYLAALGIALVLGAIHALTPGHGKTLVAAYLVGSRGTPRHAAALGAIVTLTHTGSVIALGMVTLFFSRYFLPTTLFPVLEIASGLLVVAMGISLLVQRYQGWQSVRRLRKRQAEAARAALAPAPVSAGLPSGESGSRRTIAINQPIQSREYDAVLPDADFSMSAISWRSLFTLGVSGGLVPCPDAIAILLVAIAINRILLGLSLVVTFSLGLAVVLIAIGLAMVQSRRLAERFSRFDRLVPVMPLVSAVIVLGLGLVLTVNAVGRTNLFGLAPVESPGGSTLAALGLDEEGGTVAAPFNVEEARVVYLAAFEPGVEQLYVVPAAGGDPQRFTQNTASVWDFAVSPDRALIAYASSREGGGSAIWLIGADGSEERLVLDCDGAACRNVVWSPDGTQLIYERQDFTPAAGTGIDSSSLWWVDVATGETGPVFQDTQLPGFSPRWSPNGQWLSYTAAGTTGMQIYNLQGGESYGLPNVTGSGAIWHPTQNALLMTDVRPEGALYLTHLIWFDLETQALVDLTGEGGIEDSLAAWRPDGGSIAVVRRVIAEEASAPGNQVWLMRADGSEARVLTDNADAIHQQPVWSPDGRYLLYPLYDLSQEWPEPRIFRLDVETGEQIEIVSPGNFPDWLPQAHDKVITPQSTQSTRRKDKE
jgi:ABC-type nickel/cobalt efflux system permease component RcnA/Tol biopolymer transport system component